MIVRVGSSAVGMKGVEFVSGLNIVVARERMGKTETRNGVGKTLLLRIIDFLLGGSGAKTLHIPGTRGKAYWMVLRIQGHDVTVARSVWEPRKVVLHNVPAEWLSAMDVQFVGDGWEVPIGEYLLLLGRRLLGLPAEEGAPTYRTLAKFLVRLDPASYLDPFRPVIQWKTGESLVANLFLLGLPWDAAWQVFDRQARVQEIERRVSALAEFSGKEDRARILLALVTANHEYETLRNALARYDTTPLADKSGGRLVEVSRELADLRVRIMVNQDQLAAYQRSGSEEPDVEPEQVASLFRQVGIVFPEEVRANLDSVRSFHSKVVENRKEFLRAQTDEIRSAIAADTKRAGELAEVRAGLLSDLTRSDALREYSELVQAVGQASSRVQSFRDRLRQSDELTEELSRAKIELESARAILDTALKEAREISARAQILFDGYARRLYSAGGSLLIGVTRESAELRIEIQRTGSEGISKMKILLYDLVLAVVAVLDGRSPGFLVHDSTMFDGVDYRQRAEGLKLARDLAETYGFQYIVAFNSDNLPEAADLGFDPADHVRLTLTDEECGSLFGRWFEIEDAKKKSRST